ncbi:MAG: TA system VapC family ribonuclease toxin [Alphaproteobacteria bacterium]
MILVDANLLIYAYVDTYRQHNAARAWLDEQLNGSARVGLPWASLLAFLRVTTNPRIHATPAAIEEATAQVEEWLALEPVWIPEPSARHAEIMMDLLRTTGATGNLISDAHLAAIALEHGLTLCSTDSDFARFPGLRWLNPL